MDRKTASLQITPDVIINNTTRLVIYDKLPFDIKRVYFLSGMQYADTRGKHAHHKTHQIVFCVQGTCRIFYEKQNTKQNSIFLTPVSKGFIIWNCYWHTLTDFSDNCRLMVMASTEYDEKDYIRDYELFKTTVFEH